MDDHAREAISLGLKVLGTTLFTLALGAGVQAQSPPMGPATDPAGPLIPEPPPGGPLIFRDSVDPQPEVPFPYDVTEPLPAPPVVPPEILVPNSDG